MPVDQLITTGAAALVVGYLAWRCWRQARHRQAELAAVWSAVAALRKGHYIQATVTLVMFIGTRRRGVTGSALADDALAYALVAGGASPDAAIGTPTARTGALECLLRFRRGEESSMALYALRPGWVEKRVAGGRDPVLGRHGARVSALLFAFSLYRHAQHVRGAQARLIALLRLARPQQHGEFDYLTARWPELDAFIAACKSLRDGHSIQTIPLARLIADAGQASSLKVENWMAPPPGGAHGR